MDRILKFMQQPTRFCRECGKKLPWPGDRGHIRFFCNQKCYNKYYYKKTKDSFAQHDECVANEGTE